MAGWNIQQCSKQELVEIYNTDKIDTSTLEYLQYPVNTTYNKCTLSTSSLTIPSIPFQLLIEKGYFLTDFATHTLQISSMTLYSIILVQQWTST